MQDGCPSTNCTSNNNGYVYISLLGPMPDGSTSTSLVQISADGGTGGSCTGAYLWFNDFSLN